MRAFPSVLPSLTGRGWGWVAAGRYGKDQPTTSTYHRASIHPRPLPVRKGRGLILLAFFAAAPAFADSRLPPAALAYTQLPDARQEAAARALMADLRCLVCQGQSIADSDAEMAGDMRALVRRRIAAGEQPAAVRDWLVARYGTYVTYDPPLDWLTGPLWLAPLLLLGAGVWLARRSLKRRKARG